MIYLILIALFTLQSLLGNCRDAADTPSSSSSSVTPERSEGSCRGLPRVSPLGPVTLSRHGCPGGAGLPSLSVPDRRPRPHHTRRHRSSAARPNSAAAAHCLRAGRRFGEKRAEKPSPPPRPAAPAAPLPAAPPGKAPASGRAGGLGGPRGRRRCASEGSPARSPAPPGPGAPAAPGPARPWPLCHREPPRPRSPRPRCPSPAREGGRARCQRGRAPPAPGPAAGGTRSGAAPSPPRARTMAPAAPGLRCHRGGSSFVSRIRPQSHKTHKPSVRGARERRREARLLLPRSGKACGRQRGGGSAGGGGAGGRGAGRGALPAVEPVLAGVALDHEAGHVVGQPADAIDGHRRHVRADPLRSRRPPARAERSGAESAGAEGGARGSEGTAQEPKEYKIIKNATKPRQWI